MISFQEQYENYKQSVDRALAALPWEKGRLSRCMAYSLLGGGKRLRPVIVLAAAALMGGDPAEIISPACGLELIHTYSLIHDDLPCMDDDDTRRGLPASHIAFGEAAAVLAGDALLTLGLELVASPLPGIPPERSLRAVAAVAAAAGWRGMAGGQMLDMDGPPEKPDLVWLEHMQQMKTGALFVAAAELGGILTGAAEGELMGLRVYAGALGAAFQIKDDMLDLEGESATLGKPAGSDLKHSKLTYPAILGPEKATAVLRQKTEEAVSALNVWGEEAAFLRELALKAADREK
ncbi:MAG: polyprenyl synthetase family protein [Gracilibacteraceae bacterium]|jgi:geranylgeranyl diphosphate synthase type II|nr:polyprenyl synthetase family protein [Gracilibacteraceae bacterium]